MSVEYLDFVDYLAIAAEVTGLDNEAVMLVARLDLADSALHAPAAGFGETEDMSVWLREHLVPPNAS